MGSRKKTNRKPPATGKVQAPKSSGKKNNRSAGIKAKVKKLNALLDQIDDAGLDFLIAQAEVLVHNLKVVAAQRTASERSTQRDTKIKLPEFDKSKIDIVEADDLRHFIVVVNNSRNFFSRDEMRTIAGICEKADNEDDGTLSLYRWFSRKRKDVLIDTQIDGPSDLSLKTMYNAIKDRYTVKK